MIKVIEDLLALQEIQWGKAAGSEREVEALRKAIPEPVLGHYDRLVVRGKKGVSILRNGVCTECHMRVPVGTVLTLAHGQDIQLCGSCGRYLFLPPGEPMAAGKPVAPPAVRRRKKVSEAAASAS
jgi:predicted  nucleic acid-binding Zn-ribbon protein